ncbi:isoaspartyl dipeptidase [Clostridium sp. TW13]|uniref:Isoaspartyl dipeptidase n=1 Tax=Inconstantimicrobium mannanitabidum TaxID=1604901 RepID=A0ACB5RII8_9CLOT|nr:isoaspartyl dipeptidase [Clostridium sp. TW13]
MDSMLKVIKNVEIFAPKCLGKKDILIVDSKIGGIFDKCSIDSESMQIEYLDGEGLYAFPGFIDSHVHIIGGGGEGGFSTRTPEILLSEFIKAGISTVVGCIGTDGVCRDMNSLLAKARGLEEEGISTYCYTGSYEIPIKTVTETPKSDIILIDKIIGVGEVALSDHRSSQPSYDDFVKLVASARVGGLLSGKPGIVNVHLGNGIRKMEFLFKIINETEIPATQLLPTHINRTEELFNMGMEYVKRNGYVDFTTSSDEKHLESSELTASQALGKAYKMGVNMEHITFTSDGNGSLPIFNESGEYVGLGIGSVQSLYKEVRKAILEQKVPIEEAVAVITSNVSKLLKLNNKGSIEEGKDADIVLVTKDNLEIKSLLCKGKMFMQNNKILKYGTFEKQKE